MAVAIVGGWGFGRMLFYGWAGTQRTPFGRMGTADSIDGHNKGGEENKRTRPLRYSETWILDNYIQYF